MNSGRVTSVYQYTEGSSESPGGLGEEHAGPRPIVRRRRTLTLFLAWIFLLDPLNRRLGAPSIFGDWERGHWKREHWKRTLALAAAGAVCGVLWETWNYWAAAKWTYDLPFLGPLETLRLFEMPLAGFSGFPPFAVECWVMFQTLAHVLGRGLRLEPVREADGIL